MIEEELVSQAASKTVISSGNVELDSKMGGGIPVGSLTLIEGGSGSGKSVLSQQILWGGLHDGFSAALFTSENTVKSLISQMQSIDLDILDFLLLTKFRVYPMELARLGPDAPSILIQALKKARGRDILAVDSFTSAIAQAATSLQIVSFFEECKRLCADGATILITLHPDGVDGDLIGPIRSMCDTNLLLHSEQDGQR
jgi:flagellar protein FlaH